MIYQVHRRNDETGKTELVAQNEFSDDQSAEFHQWCRSVTQRNRLGVGWHSWMVCDETCDDFYWTVNYGSGDDRQKLSKLRPGNGNSPQGHSG